MKTIRTTAFLIHLVVISGGLFCLGGCQKKETAPVEPPSNSEQSDPTDTTETEQVAAEQTKDWSAKLVGRWIRPDGGYVIEIRSVHSDGQLEASYFNPGPIHVAVAKASEKEGSVEVYLELRDINYPGSNYTLTYDAQRDVLVGNYFQAVEGQTFPVGFIRAK